jgi:glycosyltransferase involved in cell wall biosynthesis
MYGFRLLVISAACPPIRAPESALALFLCERFARRGIEVHLLTSRGAHPKTPLPASLHIHPLLPNWGWLQLPRLAWFLFTCQPDAILLQYIDWIYGHQPMITFAPALARWFCPNKRFVTLFNNENGKSISLPSYGILSRLTWWLAARFMAGDAQNLHQSYGALLRDSNAIITQAEEHLKAFARAHPGVEEKANLIPCPPILRIVPEAENSARRRGRERLGINDQSFLVVYFGYLYPSKGVETLLRAFGHIVATTIGSEARLVIVGGSENPSYLEELQHLVEETGGLGRVHWTNHCEPEDEAASLFLRASDLCVLPFDAGVRLNNSSFAVAASHGLPIVTTRGESLEAPFLDGENVRLCPPKDPASLAAAIEELIRSPETRKRLAAGARKLAEDHFSWDRVIKATLLAVGYKESRG